MPHHPRMSPSPGEACQFCKVSTGKTPSHVVFADEMSMAFLDHRPLFPGHCLVIPKEHHETLEDLPSALLRPLFTTVRLLAQAVERAVEADGTFVAINNRVSQSVPHLHVHIVPRKHKDGLRGFFWPRARYESQGAAIAVRDAIRSAVAGIRPETVP